MTPDGLCRAARGSLCFSRRSSPGLAPAPGADCRFQSLGIARGVKKKKKRKTTTEKNPTKKSLGVGRASAALAAGMSGSAPIQHFRTSQMCCRKGHGKGGGSSEAPLGHPEGKRSLRIPFPAVGSAPSPCDDPGATRVGLQCTKLRYKNEVLELKLGFFFSVPLIFSAWLVSQPGFSTLCCHPVRCEGAQRATPTSSPCLSTSPTGWDPSPSLGESIFSNGNFPFPIHFPMDPSEHPGKGGEGF